MKEITVEKPEFSLDLVPFEKHKEILIHSDEDAAFVSDRISEIRNQIKSVEDQRMKYTRPLDDIKGSMIADEREITEPLKQILTILKRKVRVWLESQEDIRKEEAERQRQETIAQLEATAEEARLKAMTEDDEGAANEAIQTEINLERIKQKPAKVDSAIRGKSGISALSTHWKFEVVDEAKVPREFLLVDEKKLGQLARKEKGEAKVAGVRFFAITGLVQTK